MTKSKETIRHNDDGTVTVALQRPVQLADRTLNEITMRRLKVRDVIETAGSRSEEEKEVRVIARISDINPEDLHEVDYADWKRVQEVFTDFLK